MAVNPNNLEEVLISELHISKEEAKTFILIVKSGKMNPEKISKMLKITSVEALRVARSLIEKGMIIDTTSKEYEALHPRFAISNRYRIHCQEDNINFKKNTKIDNIGLLLEHHYENARTK